MEISQHETPPAGRLLIMEKYRLLRKLRASGVDCLEDSQGKFRIWVRLNSELKGNNTSTKHTD